MNEVEQIKSRLDIISLIQEYIPLKPAGQNMKGLCPFHEEKTPSFMVHPTRQSFHCFGCGASGDIFSFMQKQENLEFPEALKILAQKAGVELKSYDPARQTLHNKLQEITAAAVVFYEQNLWSDQGQTARQYLIKIRGLEEKIIKQFHLGLAGSNWDGLTKHLRAKGYSFDLLTQSGLVIDKRRPQGLNFFDRFRDRIMFPITNLHGYPVGFTGRLLPQLETKLKTGKYVNTPETPIFRKSHLLFGLAQAKQPIKQAETAIVVEGQMDVLMAHQGQTPNTVAGSGTFLTEAQLGLLKRYTNTIILALDTDQAGEQASLRAVKLVWQQGLEVKIAGLPTTSKDPAELIQQNPAAWQKIIKQATPFLDHYLDVVSSRFDLSTRQGKKSVGQIILPLLVYLTDPIDQSYYTQKLAEQLDVDVKFIQEAFSQAAKKEFSPPRPFKPATIEKKTINFNQR